MNTLDEPRLLILETSDRPGLVALACGEQLCGVRPLDDARRQVADLAPAVADLLAARGWRPRELHAVLVSRGPGSYTGLRVGIMSAKAFAYATGCALLAVDTFAAIAAQAPLDLARLDVLADAQQDKVYAQPFMATATGWEAAGELVIRPFADWLAARAAGGAVTGPGLRKWRDRLPAGTPIVDAALWAPGAESLLRLGLRRYREGQRDDLWSLEPLYLRPSSAEEQWQRR